METGETSAFNAMQRIKRDFFAMRNGIIADTLRRSGSPFRIIFGLNLPQISEIAREAGNDRELAESLWANTTTRESMLAAPMMVDREQFTIDDAKRWIKTIPAHEVADVLSLKLLKYQPYAADLAVELAESTEAMERYAGVRLMFNIVRDDVKAARDFVRRMLETETDTHCRNVAIQLSDECDFLLEDQ